MVLGLFKKSQEEALEDIAKQEKVIKQNLVNMLQKDMTVTRETTNFYETTKEKFELKGLDEKEANVLADKYIEDIKERTLSGKSNTRKTPVEVRQDGDKFKLVEWYNRVENAKALKGYNSYFKEFLSTTKLLDKTYKKHPDYKPNTEEKEMAKQFAKGAYIRKGGR